MRLGSQDWVEMLGAETVDDALRCIVRNATYAERMRCQMAIAPHGGEHYARAIAECEADIERAKERIKAAASRGKRAA